VRANVSPSFIEPHLALQALELSPRELAVGFIDEKKYFISEASVYRLLKARDLITGPAYVVIKAANEFKDKTTRSTSFGRRTSPTSRSPAGAGTTYERCWATSRATSWRGGSVLRCELPTSPPRSIRHWRHRALMASPLLTDRGCSATRARLNVAGDLADWLIYMATSLARMRVTLPRRSTAGPPACHSHD